MSLKNFTYNYAKRNLRKNYILLYDMSLTIKSLLDLCDYIKAICISDAVVIIITLTEKKEAMTVKDIIDYIIHETKGKVILRDQSVRNTMNKLTKLNVTLRIEEKKGKRKIHKYQLSDKGEIIIKGLEVFIEEIRRRAEV